MVNYKILWVEDDATMIMGLVRPFVKEGFQIDTSLDIEKGKQKLLNHKYDLIILDIILPSGKELQSWQDIKNIEKFYGLEFLKDLPADCPPILVFTVVNDEKTIEHIRNFPQVKDVLSKGITKPSQLKEKVMNILNKESKLA